MPVDIRILLDTNPRIVLITLFDCNQLQTTKLQLKSMIVLHCAFMHMQCGGIMSPIVPYSNTCYLPTVIPHNYSFAICVVSVLVI